MSADEAGRQKAEPRNGPEPSGGNLTQLIRGLVPGMMGGNRPPPQLEDYPRYLQLLATDGLVSMEQLAQLTRNGRATAAVLEPQLTPLVGKQNLLAALATHFDVVGIDLEEADISPVVGRVIPEEVSKAARVVCVDINEDGMTVAMADPDDGQAVALAQNKTDFKVVKRMVALGADLAAFQELLYGTPRTLTISPRDIVDDIIRSAIQLDASDIHIEPLQDEIVVRFRKDGILINTFDIRDVAPKKVLIQHLKTSLPVVVKNKSGASGKTMNIAESQRPQDGRIYLPGRGLDLRVSILPTVHGESVVIRIHRAGEDEVDFRKLGFSERILNDFLRVINSPYGIILVSGPTGSGKTTTLYNVMRFLNHPEKKLITIEDPVESVIPRITQVQTNPAKGVTFAEALRSFLRHDPDIIMVGEVRDQETAVMAVEASLTGHLVLSSIHANDAVRTLTRLRDLGVNSLLITSTCLGTLAQRLVRRTCPDCARRARFSLRFMRLLERYQIPFQPDDMREGAGCPRCNHTGYQGRTGVFEFMVMSPELRDAINRHASDAEVEHLARRQGMRLMIEDALTKAAQGITTEAEVLRVTLTEVSTRSDETAAGSSTFAAGATPSGTEEALVQPPAEAPAQEVPSLDAGVDTMEADAGQRRRPRRATLARDSADVTRRLRGF